MSVIELQVRNYLIQLKKILKCVNVLTPELLAPFVKISKNDDMN